MNPSMYLGGQAAAGAGGAPSKDTRPPPRPKAISFDDLSEKIPDPLLVERQHRLRRIFGGVMAGAVALLVLAGISGMMRRTEPEATLAAGDPGVQIADVPSTPTEALAPATDTIGNQTATTARPDRLTRPHRPKAAPLRKTRTFSSGRLLQREFPTN